MCGTRKGVSTFSSASRLRYSLGSVKEANVLLLPVFHECCVDNGRNAAFTQAESSHYRETIVEPYVAVILSAQAWLFTFFAAVPAA
jgi:hypothetical protein